MIPKDEHVRPFDVEHHRVDVTITNTAAVTVVTQVFRNHTDRAMEATFVFPIPKGAAVSDFSLWINGKKTPGAVLEKKEARRIYESIVRRARDPGLVEYMDGKLFRASIFPIPPRGTQRLEIKFGQVLQKRAGMYRYVYPLSVGQAYTAAKTQKDFTLTARLLSPIPVSTVYSPSHKISTHRTSPKEVLLGLEEMYSSLDRDFELFVGLSQKDIGLNIMTHDPDGEGGQPGYFMVALAPRVDVASHKEIGQTFTFVMDTSGSMAGDKMEQAKKTLEFCISRLQPSDAFNVIRFSTDVEALFEQPRRVKSSTLKQGLAFSRALVPAGGTAIQPALERALKQRVLRDKPHQIIFVTDGIPTVGNTDPGHIVEMVRKHSGHARIFTFGLGFDVNTHLLDGIASKARGRSDYVKPGEKMEAIVAALYTRISSPVLTDIKIDFGGARVYDLYPEPIPDLFRGDQVVLFGRHRKAFSERIKITGRAGSERKKYVFGGSARSSKKPRKGSPRKGSPRVDFVAPLEFLPKIWAARKVGFLLEQVRLHGEAPELKKEIVRLAKKFGLVTPYTSYLAVDDSEFEPARPPHVAPIPQPLTARQKSLQNGRTSGLRSSNRKRAKPSRMRDSKTKRRAFKGFAEQSGEASVAAAEATRAYKESMHTKDKRGMLRRYIAGRTFAWSGHSWVEAGIEHKKARMIVVEAYSTAYFDLLRKHRILRRVIGLGDRVIVKLDGRVYKFTPPTKKK